MLVGFLRFRAASTAKLWNVLTKHHSVDEVKSIVRDPRNAGRLDFENLSTGIFRLANARKNRDLPTIDYMLKLCETKESTPHQLASLCSTLANTKVCAQIPKFVLQRIERSNLEEYPAASLVNMLSSFAMFPQRDNNAGIQIITQELATASRDYSKFSVQDLTTASLALAKLSSINNNGSIIIPRLVNELATRNVSEFSIESMVSFLRASALSLQQSNYELIARICNELCSRDTAAFTPRDISNLLSSLATMNMDSSTLVDVLCKELTKRNLFKFPRKAIDNIYWSCAVLDRTECLPAPREDELHLTGFDSHGIAMLLWAMIKTNNVEFAHRLCSELSKRECFGDAQDISRIMYSCAKLGIVNVELLSRICEVILIQKPEFTNQSIANICWALGKLQYAEDRVASLLVETILERRRLADFPILAISSMMLGLANLHYKHKPLCRAVAQHAVTMQHDLNEQVLLNLAWSFAVLDVLHLPPVQLFFQHVTGGALGISSTQAKQQLAQTQLAWSQTNPNASALLDRFVISNNIPLPPIKPGYVQLGIFGMIRDRINVPCESETHVCNGSLSVDILVPSMGFVIEIDGPQHYNIYPLPAKRCGSTVFKHRLLKRAGFKVKSIRVHHFTKLTHVEQVKYIDALVKEIYVQK